jgi:hypothetical protein
MRGVTKPGFLGPVVTDFPLLALFVISYYFDSCFCYTNSLSLQELRLI